MAGGPGSAAERRLAREGALTEADFAKYPWLKITRQYIKSGIAHDLDEIKEAVAKGWGEEASAKLRHQVEEA